MKQHLNIKLNFILFFILLPVIIIIDYVWLGIIASGFYKNQLQSILNADVNIVSALIVYILIIFGIVLFVLPHKLASKPFSAFFIGALFGFTVYGIYDFTNHAVLKNWTLPVSMMDVMWGSVLCGFISCLGKTIEKRLVKN